MVPVACLINEYKVFPRKRKKKEQQNKKKCEAYHCCLLVIASLSGFMTGGKISVTCRQGFEALFGFLLGILERMPSH